MILQLCEPFYCLIRLGVGAGGGGVRRRYKTVSVNLTFHCGTLTCTRRVVGGSDRLNYLVTERYSASTQSFYPGYSYTARLVLCTHLMWVLGYGCGCRCMRGCVSANAVLFYRNYVSYTSRKTFVHMVKLLIIILNRTYSCCVLFVLYDWNVTKTNSSAHFLCHWRINILVSLYSCIQQRYACVQMKRY